MRILTFANRNFKEIIRDPLSIIFAIILPLFLLYIYLNSLKYQMKYII